MLTEAERIHHSAFPFTRQLEMLQSESAVWKGLPGKARRAIPQPDSKKSGVDFTVSRWVWPRSFDLLSIEENDKGDFIDEAVKDLYVRFPDLDPTHPRRSLSTRLSLKENKAYDTVCSQTHAMH